MKTILVREVFDPQEVFSAVVPENVQMEEVDSGSGAGMSAVFSCRIDTYGSLTF